MYNDNYPRTTRVATKTLTFTGGTPDTLGDHDSAVTDPYTIFTVTGTVSVKVFGICTTLLTGGATLDIGVAADVDIFVDTADAETIDAGELFTGTATPLSALATPTTYIVTTNILLTLGAANITDGVVTVYCVWEPVSNGASVV